ncbi:MAG: hypothetical protein NTV93_12875 [Verrucomicrobia bacterium]|nr:hypothetical protein [Verrucomicrobiota bacterium]
MPVNFYAAFFSLSKDERRQFHVLTEEDGQFEAAVAASTQFWRDQLRPRYQDHLLCRQMFLAHAVIRTAQCTVNRSFGRQVILALTLALADKVEARVRELDQEENHGPWR